MQTLRFPVASRLCLFMTVLFAASPLYVKADEAGNAAARAFNGAAALQNAGRHERAAQKWIEFLAAYPNYERIDQAHYYLGVCQLRTKKFTEAADTFSKVLATWPNFPRADTAQYNLALARYELAAAADNDDLFRKAATEFATVATKYPKSDFADDSLYFQGDCMFNVGDTAAAIPLLQKLVSQYSNSGHLARAYYDLGIGLQELGRIEESAKTYETYLAKSEFASDALSPEVRLRFGICLHQLNRLDQAAKEFDTASRVKDFDLADYARLRLAQTRQDQQMLPEAAKIFEELAAKFPKSQYRIEALKSAGQCFFLVDKFPEAERNLKRAAADKQPAAAEATYWLGKTQLKLNQSANALLTFDQGIIRFAGSPFLPHLKLARIDTLYALPDRRKETLPLYEAFLQEYSNHELAGRARYMAGLAALGSGQYAKVRQYAEPLLQQENLDDGILPGAMYIVAESYLLEDPDRAENRDKAEVLYRNLITRYPEHTRAARGHLRIGWCLLSAKKFDDAIAHLSAQLEKLDKQTQLPEANFLIGQCHAAAGRHRDSITACDAALAANPKWSRKDEVLMAASTSHEALQETDAASARLRTLIETIIKSPLRPEALYRLGELARNGQRLGEAGNWFNQIVSQHADSDLAGPAMHALATIRYSEKNYPDAAQWADRLMQANVSTQLKSRARFVRGLARHSLNQHAQAIEDLSAYQNQPVINSEAVTAGHRLALSHIALKHYPEAQAALDKVLATDPKFSSADAVLYELGHSLLADETKASEAALKFGMIAEKYPESSFAAESLFRVASYHIDLAKRATAPEQKQRAAAKAETALKHGISKAKEKGLKEKIQYQLGDLLFSQNRFKDAADVYSAMVAEFPNGSFVASGKYFLAECKYRQGLFEQALPLYSAMVDAKFPDDDQDRVNQYRAQSLYRGGDCAAKLKRWAVSESLFRKLIEQFADFPQRADAAYGLGFALQQQNKTDLAIATYEQVTNESETESAAKARFMIGEIAFGQKRYEDAIEHFLLVSVGYPYQSWQALARFEAARCFSELGEKQRAMDALREMIQKHPEHARTEDAKKMLSELQS